MESGQINLNGEGSLFQQNIEVLGQGVEGTKDNTEVDEVGCGVDRRFSVLCFQVIR